MTVSWEAYDPDTLAVEPGLEDVRVVDAYNRFARHATMVVDDPDADRLAAYPAFKSVKLRVKRDIDPGFVDRFGGFVIDPRYEDDKLVVDLLSHDFWLKRRQVFKDYTNQAKSAILEDLITTLTPLTYDPAQVALENDDPITRTWRGQNLADVIREIASQSDDEEFGASIDAVFFFRAPAAGNSPRDFTPGEYLETSFETDGRVEVNRVTLYYGEPPNTGAVSVNDQVAQLELQAQTGAPNPVVTEFTTTYPEIDSETAAIAKAQELLENQSTVQVGEIVSWEAFDVVPGDVARVQDAEKGIDAEFVVAELEYSWAADETRVRVAENRAGVTDILVALSNEVTRIDNRDADAGAVILSVVDLNLAPLVLDVSFEVRKRNVLAGFFRFGDVGNGIGPVGGGGKLGLGLDAASVVEVG